MQTSTHKKTGLICFVMFNCYTPPSISNDVKRQRIKLNFLSACIRKNLHQMEILYQISLLYKSSKICYCYDLQVEQQRQQLDTIGSERPSAAEHVLCSCNDTSSTSKQINLDYNNALPVETCQKHQQVWSLQKKKKDLDSHWPQQWKNKANITDLQYSTQSAVVFQTIVKLAWQWLNDSPYSAGL